jgi:hypothetical protein
MLDHFRWAKRRRWQFFPLKSDFKAYFTYKTLNIRTYRRWNMYCIERITHLRNPISYIWLILSHICSFCRKPNKKRKRSTLWLLVRLRVISHFIERKFTNSDSYMYYCICHERKEYMPFTWRKRYSILQLKLRFSLKKMWSHVISQLQSINNNQTFRTKSVFSKGILFLLQIRVFLSPVGLFHTILSLCFV